MKWKHLFIDLDGTTIISDPNALPTKRVIRAISNIQQIMRVSIATGRTLRKSLYLFEQLNISSLSIIASGIQLYDPKNKLIIHEHEVSKERLYDVLKILQPMGHVIHAFNGENDIEIYQDILPKKVLSLFILGLEVNQSKQIERSLSHYSDIVIHRMTSWKGKKLEDLEICSVLGTKLYRLREICKTYGIKEHDCIVAGDGLNDYDMLMAGGFKIAMGNAHPDLKKIADIIAPPVEEDGLAVVLEKILTN
jgi:HAD superfamily hydrolase (TIGR01484 family)